MKILQILGLLSVLVFSLSALAQEKENEKPKEKPAEKQADKPKDDKLNEAFRKSDNPHGFLITIWSGPRIARPRPFYLPPVTDVTNVEVVVSETNQDISEENICLPARIHKVPGEVTTEVHNPLDYPLTYNYTVSGGKIIGQGKKVFWDLSGVKPGTYTITAAVDDGCGFCGMTKSKTVIVKE